MTNKIICIQAFVKPDLLENLLTSLASCIGIKDYTILIWLDSTNNMVYKKREDWFEKNKLTFKVAEKHKNLGFCKEIIIKQNDINLGTSKTCFTAISYALSNLGNYVIFTEDDTLFSRDSLLYFEFFYNNNFFDDKNLWSIMGESPFYDSKAEILDELQINKIIEKTKPKKYANKYTTTNWVNSTQFAITTEVWNKYGEIRGRKMGAIEFGELCKSEGGYSILPIISRVRDVGMTSQDGYSVYYHGNNVGELKNTYFYSDLFDFDTYSYEKFDENKDQLFKLTSQIEKIDQYSNEFIPNISSNELDLLKSSIIDVENIVEFGVGVSTKKFLEHNKSVFSFDTNQILINKVKENIPNSFHKNWKPFHINLGKIKFLGYPENDLFVPIYVSQIENSLALLSEIIKTDLLIFNNGRFRVLTQAISLLYFPNAHVLIRDYTTERKHYDLIFDFCETINHKETMFLTKRKKGISNEFLFEVIEKYKLDSR